MNASQKFVYTHRAKLAWKQVKRGVGYLAPLREEGEAFKPFNHDTVLPGGYIETPVRS